MFSRDFYAGQHDLLGIDSGFVAQGYFMPCFSEREVATAHARIAMQQASGSTCAGSSPTSSTT